MYSDPPSLLQRAPCVPPPPKVSTPPSRVGLFDYGNRDHGELPGHSEHLRARPASITPARAKRRHSNAGLCWKRLHLQVLRRGRDGDARGPLDARGLRRAVKAPQTRKHALASRPRPNEMATLGPHMAPAREARKVYILVDLSLIHI